MRFIPVWIDTLSGNYFKSINMAKKNYKLELDKIFSKYIRLRDSRNFNGALYFNCISCGRTMPFEQADCGHYINRANMSTRFSEKNCNAQCRHCNRFMEGNMSGYRQGLILKIGEPSVLMLESQKNEIRKYCEVEYKALISHYKKEVKRLEKEKL